jgi:hypothetical protein
MTSGCLCRGNAALACGSEIPQVAERLRVMLRPSDSPMPDRASRPWTGATRPFGVPGAARATVGMCTAIPPSPQVAPGPSVLGRKAVAHRGRQRPEANRCLPRPTPSGTASPRRGRWEVAPGVALRVIMMKRQDVATLRARSRG